MMDFPRSRDACVLNTDEASLIETAVRAAVMSVLKVFYEVSEKRSHRYEVKLAAAERENAALRSRLESAEQELQTLHQISPNYNISTEVTFSADVPETESEPAFSLGVSESAGALVMKEEETFHESKLFIKSERTDECSPLNLQNPGNENGQTCQQIQEYGTHNIHKHSVDPDPGLSESERRRLTRYENVRRYRERIRADPVKYLAWKQKNHLRYLQNRKTINELPEPMKKLQRKAWREATRRHRAKKLTQASSSAGSMSQTPERGFP
ncbi:hypothetical protein C0J50_0575 [Silurus asotus]|uniref:Uncharacterized protein n=1 Tax=Silurus asotus TaxID=30991 RepID=A0AAD5FDX9_SILAS|nr:hypothetical protein C0J50_0575 [Silurus asotus]